MTPTNTTIIGDLVANDYRTAAIFGKYGIDFCCNGNRAIADACTEGNIDENLILIELQEVINQTEVNPDSFNDWPIELLADYIVQKHHRYVDKQIPVLKGYLEKLCKVHGDKHPELFDIKSLFDASAGELTMHMKKEELMLFPQVQKMVKIQNEGVEKFTPTFGTFKNPISAMMDDHVDEGERFRKISELTNEYNVPTDGCSTYSVTYSLLQEFEKDLHLHIHLENNILFPKALEMEIHKN